MAVWAIVLCTTYLALVFGLNSVVQSRSSGSSGWVRQFGATTAERCANTMFLISCALDLLAPVLVLAGALAPMGWSGNPVAIVAGFAAFAIAIPSAVLAQRAMGPEWRTGIDPEHHCELVSQGPFALVRNPVYTTMLACSAGVALLVPTILAPVALLGCLAAVEVQTRLVEEPFLEQAHGRSYRDYCARVGRFLPSIGRRSFN